MVESGAGGCGAGLCVPAVRWILPARCCADGLRRGTNLYCIWIRQCVCVCVCDGCE